MLRATCILLGLFVTVDSALEGFIVGGRNASIIRHPHSVYLKISCKTEDAVLDTWFCGGAILNQMFIISAGHCFVECIDSHNIVIYVGHVHNEKGKQFRVANFTVHEKYSADPFVNDIALVRASKPMILGNKVKRIALMRKPPSFKRGLVAGWGWIDEDTQTTSHFLKFVRQNVWSRKDCIKLVGVRPYKGIFCASADDKTNYPSGGDSGSPFIVNSYIQVGLVSFKIPTVRDVIVYTNVSYYFRWIERNYNKMSCQSERE